MLQSVLSSVFTYIDDEVFDRMSMEEVNDKLGIIFKQMRDKDEAEYINAIGNIKNPKIKQSANDCFESCFPAEKEYLTPERFQRALNGQ